MTSPSYVTETGWRAYARIIPDIEVVGRLASEESWTWKGSRVHIDRIANGDSAIKVLLVHGIGGYGRLVLGAFGLPLADAGIEVLAPDLPGYGLTLSHRRDVTFGNWVACLVDLVEREASDGRPLTLMGFSLGGTTAYHAATRHPAVAALASTTLLDLRRPEVLAGVARFPRLTRAMLPWMRGLRWVIDPIAPPPRLMERMAAIANDPELVKLCVDDRHGGATRLPLRFYRTLIEAEPAIEPEEFDRPVLVLHPAEDRMTPIELSREFVRRLPDARLVELEGCGHFPVEEPGKGVLEHELTEFIIDQARSEGRRR
jgi:pimeloyl-ACP methyl ester carboxylesterase